ncbi:radical SAM/SPASM domain-containing protein [Pendulispora albinea]|uniref:Radical SAM protein n=1 Tax=Pendulispora albinea TaxID=2741071 RepID=A0ABZ2LLB5_9BACT
MRKVLINIEATPSCPASCAMCPRSLIGTEGNMSLATMEKVVSMLDPSFVWEVDMAGRGEPTIHPQFVELCEIMARPKITTGIVTTGVTMTPANILAFEKHLDIIRVSVSSIVRETFDKIHIGLKHAQIWKNIAALAEVAAHKTVIHLTGGPTIYEHLPQTVEHLRKLGFRRFKLLTLWNRGGYFETNQSRERRQELLTELALDASEDEVWSEYGRARFLGEIAYNKLKNPRYCPIGASSVTISYKGDIGGCFQDFGLTSVVGHVDTHDIKTHIQNRAKELGNMPICQGCDAHKVTLFQLSKPNPPERSRLPMIDE